MNTYKVTFVNGKSVNILAKNKEEIDSIITFALCGGSIERVWAEIKTYQRLYKNGRIGRELSFAPGFIISTWLANN